MAKLLPPSKSSIVTQKQANSLLKTDKFFSANTKTKTTKVNVTTKESPKLLEDTLTKIEKKVIKIDKLLKDSLLLSKKENERKRVGKEKESFEGKEKELEKRKPKATKGAVQLPTSPKMSFLDRIKNFIIQTVLGFITVRLIEHLPKLLSLLPTIIKVTDFITDLGGKLLDGLVTFVDWGYKAIDGTRQFAKQLGGEGLAQNFDKFAGAIDNVLEIALIAALATADSGGDGGGEGSGGGRGGGRSGRGGAGPGGGFRQTGGKGGRWQGLTYSRILDEKGIKSSLDQSDNAIMKRYFQRYGRDAFIQRFGEEGLKRLPGGMQRGLLQKGARSAFVRLSGKGGAKAILGFVRPLLKRLPIIGALIDFGLSVALGEDPGRAAFKAIGAGLLGSVGAAIGSLAFGFGGIVGGILGSIGGDAIGGALYDAFFKNKKPKQKQGKANKLAGGGQPATRGGKPVTGPTKRTLKKKKKAPRTLRATPSKLKPGGAVGGEKQIKKLYPESKDKTKMSPFDFLKNSYDAFSKTTGLGALVALAIKPLMGDRPSYADYKNVGVGINNWMNSTISSSGTMAYAGGGEVKMESIVSGKDYSDVIAKSVQESVAPEVDKTIQDLMRQLMLKPQEVQKEKSPGQDPNAMESGEDFGGDATDGVGGARLFMAAGFPMLAAAILSGNVQAESGWKGQRTPWVLNDGAGTNKGLISWNRSRIVNAEKFLGKPLEKASNAEQVKWIKEELRQYGLLDEFMNPNSTEEQLKRASYKYIGWGIEGDRWKYSSRIFAALQRGDKGTYVPGGQNIGAGSGNWRFGLTGRTFMQAKGWSHAHFQSFDGSVDTLVRDTVPLAKRMASSGLKPELSDGTPILANKDNDYYVNLIRRGQSLHTHSGRKAAVDINMPGFPMVPFTLKDFQYDPGGGGNYATVPGSGKTVLMHMSKKPDGSAFHGKIGTAIKDNFMLKLHKGEMYKVVDKDSVDLFGKDFIQDIIDIENKSQLVARAPSIIEKLKSISGYTDYENPESEIQYIEVPVEVPVPMPVLMGGRGFIGGGGVNSNDSFDRLAIG